MGRRFLNVFSLVVLLCSIASAQSIGGKWYGEIALLPSPPELLRNAFEFTLSWEDWSITSTSEFLGTDGWVWQEIEAEGALGFAEVSTVSLFGPLAPAFLYQMIQASFSFAETDFSIYSAYVGPDVPGVYFSGGPSGGTVLEVSTSVSDLTIDLEIGFGARLTDPGAPFTITYVGAGTYTKEYPVDPFPGGLAFTYLELAVEDIPLCCGLTFDFGFAFTKTSGFDRASFTLKNLFQFCCDISFDVSVVFTTDAKEVSVEVNWPGIEGCVVVYGDIQFGDSTVGGIEIYGFKILCELAECYALEFLTAFDVAAVEGIIGDVFQGDEFEYVKLTTCGPACCGGTWDLNLTVFLQDLSGPLFGISRFKIDASVPLMDALTITSSLEIAIPAGPSLELGWEFSF